MASTPAIISPKPSWGVSPWPTPHNLSMSSTRLSPTSRDFSPSSTAKCSLWLVARTALPHPSPPTAKWTTSPALPPVYVPRSTPFVSTIPPLQSSATASLPPSGKATYWSTIPPTAPAAVGAAPLSKCRTSTLSPTPSPPSSSTIVAVPTPLPVTAWARNCSANPLVELSV